jgi:hypothetical protein
VRVAAFPSFHLEYTLRFFLPGTRIETNYHDNYLARLAATPEYVYVLLFPEEFNPKFAAADPAGTLITGVSRKYGIFTKLRGH